MQWKSTTRKFAIACASLAAALLVAELGLRGWLAIRGRPYSASETQTRLERMLDPIREFVPAGGTSETAQKTGTRLPILHPYSGAEIDHDTGNVLAYFRDQRNSDAFEVLVVGGSVAAYFAETAKARIVELLAQAPSLSGREIVVLNYAHASYKQPQQLNRVTYLLTQGATFDAVLNLDGFNEIALGLENAHTGTNPLYPSPPFWGLPAGSSGSSVANDLPFFVRMVNLRDHARTTIERALRYRLASSAILGTWTMRELNDLARERNEAQLALQHARDSRSHDERTRRQVHGAVFTDDESERFDLCVTAWFEGSVSLDAVCRARGILYLHALQPALGDPGSKPLDAIEQAITPPSPEWMDGPRRGYPILRERGRELTARGIYFVDATQTFATTHEPLYVDPCHVNPRGNILLAERLAPELIALLAED